MEKMESEREWKTKDEEQDIATKGTTGLVHGASASLGGVLLDGLIGWNTAEISGEEEEESYDWHWQSMSRRKCTEELRFPFLDCVAAAFRRLQCDRRARQTL